MATAPMPLWHQFQDVLPAAELDALLDWTLAHRAGFRTSTLAGGVVDPLKRVSDRLRALGPMRPMLEARLGAMLPDIFARTGTRPFEPEHVELEIAAHGDGAFYKKHSDLPVGPGRVPLGGDASGRQDRLVSAVLYYFREPKGFSGGALRLFRFGGDEADHVDIEPARNSLVVFPSWAPHEVRSVSCPSGRFEDRRFAVNIWFCRALEKGTVT